MAEPVTDPTESHLPSIFDVHEAARAWGTEVAATWAVRRAIESGYQRATGRPLPTARDRTVPLGRVLVWAAVLAAAVAATDVLVDRVILRPR